MRNRRSPNQLMFEGFETEFEKWLEPGNRWVLLSRIIPWEDLSAAYETSLSAHTGRPAKDGRLVIGAVIIKHKLCLSDEETIEQIRENPYLQYFVGFQAFHKEQAFARPCLSRSAAAWDLWSLPASRTASLPACQIIKSQKPLLMTIRRRRREAARPYPVMTPNRRPLISSQ